MNKKNKKVLSKVCALSVATVMGCSVMSASGILAFASADYYKGFYSADGKYYTDYETLDEAKDAAAEIGMQIAAEGMTLLKNKNNQSLPIDKGSRVSVFGVAQDKPSTEAGYLLTDALEDEGMIVNGKLRTFYESIDTTYGKEDLNFPSGIKATYSGFNDVAVVVLGRQSVEGQEQSMVTDEKMNDSKENIGGWEHANPGKKDEKGKYTQADGATAYKHALQLTDSEIELHKYIKEQGFKKIVYLINSSCPMEMYNLEHDDAVDGILWIGWPGAVGMQAAAGILSGRFNPSGKTPDTWYTDFTADPTWQNVSTNNQVGLENAFYYYSDKDGNRQPTGELTGMSVTSGLTGVDYEEGIYLGYRYYETKAFDMEATQSGTGNAWYDKAVTYPFGYGLSYTEFEYTGMSIKLDNGDEMNGTLDAGLFESLVGKPATVKSATATVTVKNTGDVAGKETVELYMNAPYTPGGVEKPAYTLIGFGKTDVLKPGRSQKLEIKFDIQDMASYDATGLASNGTEKGYVLEVGNYGIFAMSDSHEWAVEGSKTAKGINFSLNKNAYLHLDDFSGNEIKNLFSQENGMFYSTRDNVNSKYQFNADTTANMTVMSRKGGFGDTFPTAPTEKDLTITKNTLDRIKHWAFYDLDIAEDGKAIYADGAVIDGNGIGSGSLATEKLVDADDYPWMTEVSENNSRIDKWTQKGTFDIRLSEMTGLDPYGDRVISEGRFKGKTEAQAWDEFMDSLSWDFIKYIPSHQVAQDSDFDKSIDIGYNSLSGSDSGWNFNDTFAFVDLPILAATWNTDLVEKEGQIIGNLALLSGFNAWWGASVQSHRSPFAGRFFEYLSEDGLLSGYIGASQTKGATSKGIVCHAKHCALNDQEYMRGGYNPLVWANEQTVRELYFKPFQRVAQEGETLSLCGAFARLGINNMSTNYNFMTGLFINEWGCKTISPSTDIYLAHWEANPIDLLVRTGVNSIDSSEQASGTWDATKREVGEGENKKAMGNVVLVKPLNEFSTTAAYAAGDKVQVTTKDTSGSAGMVVTVKYYEFTAAHAAGEFDAAQVKEISASELETYESTQQYYHYRDAAMRYLWVAANSARNLNGIDIENWRLTPLEIKQGDKSTLSVADKNRFGTEHVVYSLNNSKLPAGLTLNADGSITGVPQEAGTFNLIIKVAKENWITGTANVTLSVAPAFVISETAATKGEEFYSYISSESIIVEEGGYDSIDYEIVNGTLPKGLTLAKDGTIEGTPAEPGTFNISVNIAAKYTVVTPGSHPSVPGKTEVFTDNFTFNTTIVVEGESDPTIEEQIAAIAARIDALEISASKTDVDAIKADIESLEAKIVALEGAESDVTKADLDALKADLEAVKTGLEEVKTSGGGCNGSVAPYGMFALLAVIGCGIVIFRLKKKNTD